MTEQTTFSMDDLREIMRSCAGELDGDALDGDISDTTFEELGYDSLAVLEVTAKLQNHFGRVIPEDVAGRLRTPGDLADYLNSPSNAS